MRKATCFILSLLIFSTPLFAIKEAIYNAQGVKVGYIEKVNGKTIYYDKNGFTTDRIDMQSLINQELDNIERRNRAYESSEEERRKGEELGDDILKALGTTFGSSSSSNSSSSSSQNKQYLVCPMSYCAEFNATSSDNCKKCGYSLEDASVTYSKYETSDRQRKNETMWIFGILFGVGIGGVVLGIW